MDRIANPTSSILELTKPIGDSQLGAQKIAEQTSDENIHDPGIKQPREGNYGYWVFSSLNRSLDLSPIRQFVQYVPEVGIYTGPDSDTGEKQRLHAQLNDVLSKMEVNQSEVEKLHSLDALTVAFAKRFIDALPIQFGEPEIDLTLRGEIEFSWENQIGDGLCVLILPSGDLAISGMFGNLKIHGTVDWDKEDLPDFIISGLRWSCD